MGAIKNVHCSVSTDTFLFLNGPFTVVTCGIDTLDIDNYVFDYAKYLRLWWCYYTASMANGEVIGFTPLTVIIKFCASSCITLCVFPFSVLVPCLCSRVCLAHTSPQLLAYQKKKKKGKHKKKPGAGGADVCLGNQVSSILSEPASLDSSLGVVDLHDDGIHLGEEIPPIQCDSHSGNELQTTTSLPPVSVWSSTSCTNAIKQLYGLNIWL